MLRFSILAFASLILLTACQRSALDSTVKSEPQNGDVRREEFLTPPFATKEPEKYQATIVFSFKPDENSANVLEQTTFVARDGANRRLDFEIGGKIISRLDTADGKQFVSLPKQKVYTEINFSDENFLSSAPADSSLAHLLYAKPIGARFEKIGAEEIAGRQTSKYRIVFDSLNEPENTNTETLVWADENLGLPVKTEIVALVDGKPNGAKSVVELREIKTETDAGTFIVPPDFRKVTPREIRDLIKPK